VAANLSRFPSLLFFGRLGTIALSCLAGWMTYRWAGRLYGSRSAVAACAMYCLNPSILAHGSLVTTDVGTAAAMLASCWLWWRFCRSPSWERWTLACLAVLAAHLCKFTALLLWPMLLVMMLPFIPWRKPGRRWRLPGAWLLMGVTTLILLNAVYGFRGTGKALASYNFDSDLMIRIRQMLPAKTPVPLPRLFVEGFDAQKSDSQSGYQGFLFGEIYWGAKWYFFPAALLCKLPIAMLLLLAAAVASKLAPRGAGPPARGAGERSLFFGLVVFAVGVMLLGDLNIGTRYLLPAFPLAIILISRIWSVNRVAQARTRPLMPYLRDALLALLAVETLWVCPRFLTFVNFAVGGPSNGWRLLNDSDFDWGQGLIDLRDWEKSRGNPKIALAYFGYVNPIAYGIHFEPFLHPQKAKYVAVSSYFLDGLRNRMWVDDKERRVIGLPYYMDLQRKTPVAVVGHTIFIYSFQDIDAAAKEYLLSPSPPSGP
jgi:4-amino-4-deoxy-L-arabinose transferase-like glycosyltransferase